MLQEVQDYTKLDAFFVAKIVADSDHRGGLGHNTKLTLLGDQLQSINRWMGAVENAFVEFGTHYDGICSATLDTCLRWCAA